MICDDSYLTTRERYLQACADQGIPAIQVSPKVLKECRGFGKLPTFPKPSRKRIDALYAQGWAA